MVAWPAVGRQILASRGMSFLLEWKFIVGKEPVIKTGDSSKAHDDEANHEDREGSPKARAARISCLFGSPQH